MLKTTLSVLVLVLGGCDSSDTPPLDGTPEGPIVPPGDPGATDIKLEIHADQGRRPISPLIYGSNTTTGIATARYPLVRSGGNRLTAYNWENNASNAGSDYQFQNDGYLSTSNTPGKVITDLITESSVASAAVLLTVPIVDYVAADKNGGGDVRASGSNYLTTRFRRNRATKGASLSLTPDTADGFVNQDEFVNWVTQTYPAQHVIFELDNEPDLWSSTHAEVHPTAVGYDELCTRNIEYATMIKSIAPTAEVSGPANYGFNGYVNLQNAPDANGKGEFLDYYLTRIKAAEATAGHRVVDYLDLHWYPEAQGAGTRITGTGTNAAVVDARVQAPRSLWDAGYTEDSWIADYYQAPIDLLHRVQSKIDAIYPGTKVAFTEWNFGAGNDISGAVATADTLGIFGREGVGMANNWWLDGDEMFTGAAYAAFLNYDGALGKFGDTSVSATTSDVATATVYASIDSATPSRMVIVAINKSTSTKSAGIQLFASTPYAQLAAYTVTSAGAHVAAQPAVPATATNAFVYTMPPMSVSVLVATP